MNKLQATELYILKEIKRVCEKNDIRFFLVGGTLLGAVRHKGFIPWDDDIDIGMYVDDYNRFLQIAPSELGEEFFLDHYSRNKDYPLVFSKVRLRGTRFVENKGNKNLTHNEIYVDIFPYVNVAPDEKERGRNGKAMALLAQLILAKSGYHVWKGEGFAKLMKFLPVELLSMVLPMKLMRNTYDRIFAKYKEPTGLVCHCAQTRRAYLKWVFPLSAVQETAYVQFESEQMPAPKDYHAFLTKLYGANYMVLPPKEKQTTHQPLELSFGKYEDIFGKEGE